MKKTSYTFLLCLLSISNCVFSQYSIDIKAYLNQYKADSLFQIQKFEEAITEYDKALTGDITFKKDIHFYKAYCYAYLREDSLARSSMYKAFQEGFRFYFPEELEDNWFLDSMKLDKRFTDEYEEILTLSHSFINSDSLVELPHLRDSIFEMAKLDQMYRKSKVKNDDLWKIQKNIDSLNQVFVNGLINRFNGIPSYEVIGREGIHKIVLISMHSTDINFLKKVIFEIENSIKKGNVIESSDYVMLIDKFNMLSLGYQSFGTQVDFNWETNKMELKAVSKEIEPYLNKIRSVLGLVSVEQYLSEMESFNKAE